MSQPDPNDHRAIIFVTRIEGFCAIVTISKTVASRPVDNTLFGALGTRPPIWILDKWEDVKTLALTQGEVHVATVFTHRMVLGTTSHFQSYATTIVTEEKTFL